MATKLTETLKDEYVLLFSRMALRPERVSEIDRVYKRIVSNGARVRYKQVESETGVPWFFTGILHNLEASGRFDRHLHNGDPLSGPTIQVPPNRPSSEKRVYTWEESAIDALKLKQLHKVAASRWTLPDIAFALETYNGFGYRNRYPHVKSPYLWSFSNIYSCGKYIRDGQFSETAVSQQCGGLSLLRYMLDRDGDIARGVGFEQLPEDDADETRAFPWGDGPEGEEIPCSSPDRETAVYPGRYLIHGVEDDNDVAALQRQLKRFGYDPGSVDGDFGDVTERAVRLFQARSADVAGRPLEIDGIVGPSTWGALFGPLSVQKQERGPDILKMPASALSETALAVAANEIGVREHPLGSNRGPRVDQYIATTGLQPQEQHPWCMCFVYWCFETASRMLGTANSCPRKGGVHIAWGACQKAALGGSSTIRIASSAEAQRDPSLIRPGMVFFIDTGGGKGHVGLVAAHHNGSLETIEGNTNDIGSREGVGVFRRTQRSARQINLGFASFS